MKLFWVLYRSAASILWLWYIIGEDWFLRESAVRITRRRRSSPELTVARGGREQAGG